MQLLDYLSRSELESRWARVRREMDCDALIVLQTADLFYLSGTTQTSVLWFPREGEPVLAVRKSFERAKSESAIRNIVPFRSYSELPSMLPNPGQTIGWELDVVPVSTYQQIAKHFPNSKLIDGSMAIRRARGVKTPYEVDCIRQAAVQLDLMFADVATQLREGLAEFELCARIEYVMRMAGHQGLTRFRRFNMDMFYGAVSFGDTAAYPHSFDGPVGVRGRYTAVPVMGGRKQLKRGEPVVIDMCGGYDGYIADGTRIFSVGPVSDELRQAHQFILELNAWIEEQLRPGKIPGEIYNAILERVAKTPYASRFMGIGENQVKFVAHSVGLELDEVPVIAPKYDVPFEAGNVMAVEPKIFFAGIGGIGIENTYVITKGGAERLTRYPQEIHSV
ncbi:MAG TPA: Xaa-Pro peptidase family protein [Terriglobia bacterium]|nr:Xaa-Pro peptidase family protein [Terriglobia bacterium]